MGNESGKSMVYDYQADRIWEQPPKEYTIFPKSPQFDHKIVETVKRNEEIKKLEEYERQAKLERQLREKEGQIRAMKVLHEREKQKQELVSRKKLLERDLADIKREYNKVHQSLIDVQHVITEEEKEMKEFKFERNNPSTKIIITIGHTGDGKSTFCNRLTGDESEFGDQGQFKTSGSGESCTQGHSKAVVTIDNIRITVVDTPGFNDSNGQDRHHSNRLCAYLKGCGGINSFILIRNSTNVRFDASFQNMLRQYSSMFGDIFFKRLIIIATRVDYNNRQFEKYKQASALQKDIQDKFDVNHTIPVVPIGLGNYKDGLKKLAQIIPSDKYICDQIRAPIDELKEKELELRKVDQSLKGEVNNIQNEINSFDRRISDLNF